MPCSSSSYCSLLWRLYGVSVIQTLSQAAAILVAKAINSAFTQSITPETACSESPSGSWTAFGLQLVYALVVAFFVMSVWFKHAQVKHAQVTNEQQEASTSTYWVKLWDTRKFMSGEILGWAFKELTAIGVALVASGVGYVRVEEEEEGGDEEATSGDTDADTEGRRFLGDALQGDAPLSETHNEWMQVAAYAIYATILCVLVVLVFGHAIKYLEHLVAGVYKYHHFCSPYHHFCHRSTSTQKLSREHTDDLALELATESFKISQAYTINGALSGMLTLAVHGSRDDFSMGAFGLLEVYACTLLYLGGYLYSLSDWPSCFSSQVVEFLEPVAEFYKDVLACLAGFALGSIATSPGGILSGIHDNMSETAADALSATIVSALALLFLLHGCRIRVSGNLCHCIPLPPAMAKHTSHFFSQAASLAFAWAWEDFSQDFVCTVLPKIGLNPVGAVWLHALIVSIIMIPTSMILSLEAQKFMARVEKDLNPVQVDQDKVTGKAAGAADDQGEELDGTMSQSRFSCHMELSDVIEEIEC